MLTKCSFSQCNISLNHYEILCMYLSGGFHSPSPQYYGSYDTLVGNTPYHQEAVSLSPSHILSCKVHFLLWRILCVCVCVCVCVCARACVCSVTQMCPTLCFFQAALSMEFSRQEYRSDSPFPSPGDLSWLNAESDSVDLGGAPKWW